MADQGEAAEESRDVEDVLVKVLQESVAGQSFVADGDIVAPDVAASSHRVPEPVRVKLVPESSKSFFCLLKHKCLNQYTFFNSVNCIGKYFLLRLKRRGGLDPSLGKKKIDATF